MSNPEDMNDEERRVSAEALLTPAADLGADGFVPATVGVAGALVRAWLQDGYVRVRVETGAAASPLLKRQPDGSALVAVEIDGAEVWAPLHAGARVGRHHRRAGGESR